MKLKKSNELELQLNQFMENLSSQDLTNSDHVTNMLNEIISLYTDMLECKEKNSAKIAATIPELYKNIAELHQYMGQKTSSEDQELESAIHSSMDKIGQILKGYKGEEEQKEAVSETSLKLAKLQEKLASVQDEIVMEELSTKLEQFLKQLNTLLGEDITNLKVLVDEIESLKQSVGSLENTNLAADMILSLSDTLKHIYEYMRYKEIVTSVSESNKEYLPTVFKNVREQQNMSYEDLEKRALQLLKTLKTISHSSRNLKSFMKKYKKKVMDAPKEMSTAENLEEVDKTSNEEIAMIVDEKPIEMDRKTKRIVSAQLDKFIKNFDKNSRTDVKELKKRVTELDLIASQLTEDDAKTSLGTTVMDLCTNLKVISEDYELENIVSYIATTNENYLPTFMQQILESKSISYDDIMKDKQEKEKRVTDICTSYAKERRIRLKNIKKEVEQEPVQEELSEQQELAKTFDLVGTKKNSKRDSGGIYLNDAILQNKAFRIGKMVFVKSQSYDNVKVSFIQENIQAKIVKVVMYYSKSADTVEVTNNDDLLYYLNAGYGIKEVITSQEVLVHHDLGDIEAKPIVLFKKK